MELGRVGGPILAEILGRTKMNLFGVKYQSITISVWVRQTHWLCKRPHYVVNAKGLYQRDMCHPVGKLGGSFSGSRCRG